MDARQRLRDHVLVYSEVQFQRAEMKARGIDMKKKSHFKHQLLVSNVTGCSYLHENFQKGQRHNIFFGPFLEFREELTQN